ncbi:Protein MRPL-54 [Aphelenchoides avenae]|nr:Protein MRPL-54 [Aphelenchus avenae]
MSLQRLLPLLRSLRLPTTPPAGRTYAVGSKVVAEKEDKSFIETDVEKLCKYVCINYNVEATEPGPPIKPDSEYPEWLFQLDLRPPRELEDLDPEQDGWLYWRALRKRQVEQKRRFLQLRTKFLALSDSPTYKKQKEKGKYKIRGGTY